MTLTGVTIDVGFEGERLLQLAEVLCLVDKVLDASVCIRPEFSRINDDLGDLAPLPEIDVTQRAFSSEMGYTPSTHASSPLNTLWSIDPEDKYLVIALTDSSPFIPMQFDVLVGLPLSLTCCNRLIGNLFSLSKYGDVALVSGILFSWSLCLKLFELHTLSKFCTEFDFEVLLFLLRILRKLSLDRVLVF